MQDPYPSAYPDSALQTIRNRSRMEGTDGPQDFKRTNTFRRTRTMLSRPAGSSQTQRRATTSYGGEKAEPARSDLARRPSLLPTSLATSVMSLSLHNSRSRPSLDKVRSRAPSEPASTSTSLKSILGSLFRKRRTSEQPRRHSLFRMPSAPSRSRLTEKRPQTRHSVSTLAFSQFDSTFAPVFEEEPQRQPRARSTSRMRPPCLPRDPSRGAAARAAAAEENKRNMPPMPTRTKNGDPPFRRSSRDRESGVSVSMLNRSDSGTELVSDSRIKQEDPLEKLPAELITHVFSYLDCEALRQCMYVSKRWNEATSDTYVWKGAFLSKYAPSPSSRNLPQPVGGRGVGKKTKEWQDWKTMFKARKALDHYWKVGEASAVYLQGHTDSVYCVQYDEEKIITGSRDQTIRVWDIRTFKCIKVIGTPSAYETDRREYTCGYAEIPPASNLKVQPIIPQEPDQSIYHVPAYYHRASILCLQYDDEIMVTGSSDNNLIVWDIATWEPRFVLHGHSAGVLDIAFDREKIVSCSKDSTLIIWDRATGALLQRLRGHQGPVNAVQLRGDLVVSASGEGRAILWNLNTAPYGESTSRAATAPSGSTTNNADSSYADSPVATSPTDSSPSSSTQPPLPAPRTPLLTVSPRSVKEFHSRNRGLACIEFSSDCRYILAGGNDQVIYRFSTATGELVATLEGHTNLVRSLYLDGGNGRIVSGSYDMSLRVWDYETGRMMIHFPDWATSWMLSAKSDYRRIVCTSQDGRALVLDFGAGVEGVELLEG